jgi:hypothetical protein
VKSLSGLPEGLERLTLSPSKVKSLRGLPNSVWELRFEEANWGGR